MNGNGITPQGQDEDGLRSIMSRKLVREWERQRREGGQQGKLAAKEVITYHTKTSSAFSALPTDFRLLDRYGFMKTSSAPSVREYDLWDDGNSRRIARQSRKWDAMVRVQRIPCGFPRRGRGVARWVRHGIPPDLRGPAWFWYAGGPARMAASPGAYTIALRGVLPESDMRQIEADLARTFPDNALYNATAGASGLLPAEGEKSASLRRVLIAFAVHRREIGYCQGLNMVAGLLLLFLSEEKAFVMLDIITGSLLPGMHDRHLAGAHTDGAVLAALVQRHLPAAWSKLYPQGALAPMLAWLFSVFVGKLPVETVLRVWDCVFYHGAHVLFRTALALLKGGQALVLRAYNADVWQVMQELPLGLLDADALIKACFGRRLARWVEDEEALRELRRQVEEEAEGSTQDHVARVSWLPRIKSGLHRSRSMLRIGA